MFSILPAPVSAVILTPVLIFSWHQCFLFCWHQCQLLSWHQCLLFSWHQCFYFAGSLSYLFGTTLCFLLTPVFSIILIQCQLLSCHQLFIFSWHQCLASAIFLTLVLPIFLTPVCAGKDCLPYIFNTIAKTKGNLLIQIWWIYFSWIEKPLPNRNSLRNRTIYQSPC